jgi:hypothetical protein
MRIGIDFDNTIACYDGVFHAAALERGLIPAALGTDKNAVRDHLNGSGRKHDFTALQGYVYGARMDLVSLHPGVEAFLAAAREGEHEVFVISHKTRTPILGPAYDLHEAARGFLRARGLVGDRLIPEDSVFFELTKEEKVGRVAATEVDVFIDDLPEILTAPGFPRRARRILFDPQDGLAAAAEEAGLERHCDWPSITRALLG